MAIDWSQPLPISPATPAQPIDLSSALQQQGVLAELLRRQALLGGRCRLRGGGGHRGGGGEAGDIGSGLERRGRDSKVASKVSSLPGRHRLSVFGHGEVNPGHKQATEGLTIANNLRSGGANALAMVAGDKYAPQPTEGNSRTDQIMSDIRAGKSPPGAKYAGDNGSSFGQYQLHVGGIAPGGNAGPGLGDQFQKDNKTRDCRQSSSNMGINRKSYR